MTAPRKKVLVTGGQGFLGGHVTLWLLAEGHDVAVVDSPGYGIRKTLFVARGAGARGYSVDLRDRALRALIDEERPQVVVHLVERASAKRSLDDPVDDAEVNLVATLNVLESCRYAAVERVIVACSGLRLYGRQDELPIRETQVPRPDTACGIARRAVLDYLRLYREQIGLNWVVLALGSVYGPGQRPLGDEAQVSQMLGTMLKDGQPTIVGDGTTTRDFVWVEDVARAVTFALHRGDQELINIGTGTEVSLFQLYEECRRATGFSGGVHRAFEREGEVSRFALDRSRAALALGWAPAMPLEGGIEATARALRAFGGRTVLVPA